MSREVDRRGFIMGAVASAIMASAMGGFEGRAFADTPSTISVARDASPEALTRAAVGALGGMSKFVSKGEAVIVKPNIGWDRKPEQAANTNPEVLKTVVLMCLEAGAKKVRVMDRTCNDARRCYKQSGIQDAVESIGDPAATIEHIDDRKFVKMPIKDGDTLSGWTFYKDILEADRIINVPIAKHHNAARLTMSLKNIMGCLGGNRGNIHADLDHNLADLNTVMKFDLIVLDAVRILTGNGPQGGRLKDVKRMDTVVAGTDPVAVDSYGATLFGIRGKDIPHVLNAYKRNLGEIDLAKVNVIKADIPGRTG